MRKKLKNEDRMKQQDRTALEWLTNFASIELRQCHNLVELEAFRFKYLSSNGLVKKFIMKLVAETK